MRSSTPPGSKIGTKTEVAADGRDAEHPAHRGGVEHRGLVQVHAVLAAGPSAMPTW